jgi:hypothetical protein
MYVLLSQGGWVGEKKGTDTKKRRYKADQAVSSLAAPALVKLSLSRKVI